MRLIYSISHHGCWTEPRLHQVGLSQPRQAYTASLPVELPKKAAIPQAQSPQPSILYYLPKVYLTPSLLQYAPFQSTVHPTETIGDLSHLSPRSSQRAVVEMAVSLCLPCSKLYAGPSALRVWPYLVHLTFLLAPFLFFLSLTMTRPFLRALVHLLSIPDSRASFYNPRSSLLQTLLPQACSLSLRAQPHLLCPLQCPGGHPHTCT